MSVLPYLIIVPLVAAFLIVLFGKRLRNSGDIISLIASASVAFIAFSIIKPVLIQKSLIFKVGNWIPPFGIPLIVDSFSAFVILVTSIVTFAVVIYSIGYIRAYSDNWKYYALLMIMSAGVNGVLITGDLFNLFVFLEIASISVYALVAYGLESEALEGAFKYAVMSAIASSFILLGIALLYSYTGTVNMLDMAHVISLRGPARVIPFVSVLFLMGFGLKSALMPFHGWVSDAYAKAPATIPAMSSGVLIKSLGVYAIARIFFNIFGMNMKVSYILIILAILSMAAGSILAFGQSNIRRLLAYSSISQVGYIFLGFGIGTPLAIFGALFHLVNHSVAKSLIFLGSGAIEGYTGKTNLDDMSGIIAKDRVVGYSTLAGVMSISGIPPFAGFWSKIIIIFACIQSGHPVLAAIAVGVSIVTIIYYFKAFTPVLFAPNIAGLSEKYTVTLTMKCALIALAFLAIALGALLLPGPINLLMNNAVSLLETLRIASITSPGVGV